MKDTTNTQNIKLDKFYNPITENNGNNYSDEFFELVEIIAQEKTKGRINATEADLLFKILLSKEASKEVKQLSKWLKVFGNKQDKHSILINLSSKEKRYA